jgi:hypothetical protein
MITKNNTSIPRRSSSWVLNPPAKKKLKFFRLAADTKNGFVYLSGNGISAVDRIRKDHTIRAMMSGDAGRITANAGKDARDDYQGG